MEPETVIEGYKEGNQLGGSWYFELEKNLTVNRAPAYEGTVTIGHTENTLDYTVDFEFYDDNLDEGYIVSGSFSGKMEYIYDAGTLQAKGGRVTAPRAAGRQACGTYTPIDGVFRKLRQSSDVLSASGTTNEEGPVMSTGPSC